MNMTSNPYRRRGRWAGVLAGIFLLSHGVSGDTNDHETPVGYGVRPELPAYLELVRGDAAREAGLAVEALARYTRALTHFRTLAETMPDHMSGAVAYRIRYCEEEIDALRSADAAKTAAVSVAAVRELERLRRRVAELEAARENAAPRGEAESEPAPRQPETQSRTP